MIDYGVANLVTELVGMSFGNGFGCKHDLRFYLIFCRFGKLKSFITNKRQHGAGTDHSGINQAQGCDTEEVSQSGHNHCEGLQRQ